MSLSTVIDARNRLRTALLAHSGGARAVFAAEPEWHVTLWRDEATQAPTGEIAITRMVGGKETFNADITADRADAIVEALAERGVCGGDEVEDVVHGVTMGAQEGRAA